MKRPYSSWAIIESEGDYRPYEAEPLNIARDVIADGAGISCGVVVDPNGDLGKNNERYKNWHITTEHSVRGVGSGALIIHLPDRVKPENVERWDSYGLEVVSRVIGRSVKGDDGNEEIRKIIKALVGDKNSQHWAFVTNHTALHLHIQCPLEFGCLKGAGVLAYHL